MRCPFCGHEDTQVKDSRPTDDNSAIRRRRYCPSCGSRFTTFERVQLRELTVVKKNGQRVQFDRDKLGRSIRSGWNGWSTASCDAWKVPARARFPPRRSANW